MEDTTIRLRREIFDSLASERGASTVAAQVELTGIPRRTLSRILNGGEPSLTSAMRMSDVLSVPFNVLFERIEDAA